MSNKRASQDRKARLAEIQKQQKAKERKVVASIIVGCVVLLAALGSVVAFAINDSRSKQLPNLGVSLAAARCTAPTNDGKGGSQEHVGPGTQKPNETTVKYDTVPPSHGAHFVQPDVSGRDFYTASDRPVLETLVHNLEHGYTILWYDGSKVKDTATLKDVAKQADGLSGSSGKFKVVEWDQSRGQFPAGTPYALSHWGSDGGHRQFCGELSGKAVVDFVKKYPSSNAPEPNGM